MRSVVDSARRPVRRRDPRPGGVRFTATSRRRRSVLSHRDSQPSLPRGACGPGRERDAHPTDPGLAAFLARLADRGRAATGADEVVISRFAPPDLWEVLHATTDALAHLEESSFALTEGPPAAALRDHRPTFAADLTDPVEQRRWPVWTAAALEQGFRAVAAFPVEVGAVTLGVVSFHRRTPGRLDDAQVAHASALADAIVVMLLDELAGVPSVDADHVDAVTVRRDLASTRVYQASGMVMVQLGVDARQALLALRVHAFAEGRSLREVADDVLARRVRFGGGQDRHDDG